MRLIDANALMPRLEFIQEAEHQIFYGKESWGFVSKCITAVEDAPTIEERKKGKWLLSAQRDGFEGSECSQCGYHIFNTPLYGHNYCPNCGAKMKEGDQK